MDGMNFTITVDNSDLFKAAAAESIARVLEGVGLFLEGEAADELENEPRRVDTGRLKNSIAHQVDGNSVAVGTNVEYAVYVIRPTRVLAEWHRTISSGMLLSGISIR